MIYKIQSGCRVTAPAARGIRRSSPLLQATALELCTTVSQPQGCRASGETHIPWLIQNLQPERKISNISSTAHSPSVPRWPLHRTVLSSGHSYNSNSAAQNLSWFPHFFFPLILTFRMPEWLSSRLEVFKSRCRIQLSWRCLTPRSNWIIKVFTSPGMI